MNDWSTESYYYSENNTEYVEGNVTIEIVFFKGSSQPMDDDCVYIDNVRIEKEEN